MVKCLWLSQEKDMYILLAAAAFHVWRWAKKIDLNYGNFAKDIYGLLSKYFSSLSTLVWATCAFLINSEGYMVMQLKRENEVT